MAERRYRLVSDQYNFLPDGTQRHAEHIELPTISTPIPKSTPEFSSGNTEQNVTMQNSVNSPAYKVVCLNCGILSMDPKKCQSCKKLIPPTVRKYPVVQPKEKLEHPVRNLFPRSKFYANDKMTDFMRYNLMTTKSHNRNKVPKKRVFTKTLPNVASECITISDSDDEIPPKPKPTGETETIKVCNNNNTKLLDSTDEVPQKKRKLNQTDQLPPVDDELFPVKTNPLNIKITSVDVGRIKLTPTKMASMNAVYLTMFFEKQISFHEKWEHFTKLELSSDSNKPCIYITISEAYVEEFKSKFTEFSNMGLEPNGPAGQKYIVIYFEQIWFKRNLRKLRSKLKLIEKHHRQELSLFNEILACESEWRQMEINDEKKNKNEISSTNHLTNLQKNKIPKTSEFNKTIVTLNQTIITSPLPIMTSPITIKTTPVQTTPIRIMTSQISVITSPYTIVSSPIVQIVKEGVTIVSSPLIKTRTRSQKPKPDEIEEPSFGFQGPRKMLAVYPPPPEKGGITISNEDEFCLNEGEFLNDVIIDFYLKYIMNEILSEQQRNKSYVFSCFFFKRLTQTAQGQVKQGENKNLSLSQRRYNRVRKWTRKVDLFTKDFIFIPINEASHWYLAVVCFPYLNAGCIVDKTTGQPIWNEYMENEIEINLPRRNVDALRSLEESDSDRSVTPIQQSTNDSTQQSTNEGGSAQQSTNEGGSTQQSTNEGGSTQHLTNEGGSTQQSTNQGGSTQQSTNECGSTQQSTNDSTQQSTNEGCSTQQSTNEGGSTQQSTNEGDSTQQSANEGGSTQQSTNEGGSTQQSTNEGGSTQQSTNDSTQQSTNDSTQQSTNEGCSTQQSTNEGGSTQQSTNEGGSTQQSTNECCSTQQSTNEGCSTQQSTNEGCSTQQSTNEGGSTQQSINEGGSTQQSTNNNIFVKKTLLNISKENLNNSESMKEDSFSFLQQNPQQVVAYSPIRIVKPLPINLQKTPIHKNIIITQGNTEFTLSPCSVQLEDCINLVETLKISNGENSRNTKHSGSNENHLENKYKPFKPSNGLKNLENSSYTLQNKKIIGSQPILTVSIYNKPDNVKPVNMVGCPPITIMKPEETIHTCNHKSTSLKKLKPITLNTSFNQICKLKPTTPYLQPDELTLPQKVLPMVINQIPSLVPDEPLLEPDSPLLVSTISLLEPNKPCLRPDEPVLLANELIVEPTLTLGKENIILDKTPLKEPEKPFVILNNTTLKSQTNKKQKTIEDELLSDWKTPPKEPDNNQTPDPTINQPASESKIFPNNNSEYRSPCILIFDSLRGPSRSKTATYIREYLTQEWAARKEDKEGKRQFDKNTMKMCSPGIPQQDNYSDCGIFLLHYAEKIFQNPIKSYSLPIKNLSDWFSTEECALKRDIIKNVINQLHQQQNSKKQCEK